MYKLHYGIGSKVGCIIRLSDGANIPLCEANADYQAFLKWNRKQQIPLDLNSTIEPAKPEPARDLAKEIDDLKYKLETTELKVEALEIASIGIDEKI